MPAVSINQLLASVFQRVSARGVSDLECGYARYQCLSSAACRLIFLCEVRLETTGVDIHQQQMLAVIDELPGR